MKHPYPTLRQLLLQGELQRMSDKLSKAQLNSVSCSHQRCKLLIQRLPSYLAAKLCTSIINHTYAYIQYVYICIHLYTFVHRDTHAWIIYDHTMYINVHRTHGFLCLLLQRLDTLHNFSWTRTCGTSEPEPKVTRHPHDHWHHWRELRQLCIIFSATCDSWNTPPSLAVAGSHP